MVSEQSIQHFADQLNSGQPVPGGGGVSALAGALSACLGGMAIHLTVGKQKYAPVEKQLTRHLALLTDAQHTLLALMQKDEQAFAPLSDAYRLPSDTEEQQQHKQQAMQRCLWQAAQPPLEVLSCVLEVTRSLKEIAGLVSPLVISDVGCGAAMAKACLVAAAFNVWINANLVSDAAKKQTLYQTSREMLQKGKQNCEEVLQKVEESLCPNC